MLILIYLNHHHIDEVEANALGLYAYACTCRRCHCGKIVSRKYIKNHIKSHQHCGINPFPNFAYVQNMETHGMRDHNVDPYINKGIETNRMLNKGSQLP